MGEADRDGVAFPFVADWERPRGGNRFSVHVTQRPYGQSLADILLVLGMNVLLLANVDSDRHAGLRNGERLEHGFADQWPVAAGAAEIRQLNPGDGEVV